MSSLEPRKKYWHERGARGQKQKKRIIQKIRNAKSGEINVECFAGAKDLREHAVAHKRKHFRGQARKSQNKGGLMHSGNLAVKRIKKFFNHQSSTGDSFLSSGLGPGGEIPAKALLPARRFSRTRATSGLSGFKP